MTAPVLSAVDRGVHLLTRVPVGDLPPEAIIYAGYLCMKVGMCGEVMLSAYVVYAQIVEGLACDDALYAVTPFIRAEWKRAQRDYERVVDEAGRLRVRRKVAENTGAPCN